MLIHIIQYDDSLYLQLVALTRALISVVPPVVRFTPTLKVNLSPVASVSYPVFDVSITKVWLDLNKNVIPYDSYLDLRTPQLNSRLISEDFLNNESCESFKFNIFR